MRMDGTKRKNKRRTMSELRAERILIRIIYLNKPNAWLLVVSYISYIKYVLSVILALI